MANNETINDAGRNESQSLRRPALAEVIVIVTSLVVLLLLTSVPA